MKFLLLDFVLYLTSNIVTMSGLEIVYAIQIKTQKWLCRTVGTILMLPFTPLELKVTDSSQAKFLFRISKLLVTVHRLA